MVPQRCDAAAFDAGLDGDDVVELLALFGILSRFPAGDDVRQSRHLAGWQRVVALVALEHRTRTAERSPANRGTNVSIRRRQLQVHQPGAVHHRLWPSGKALVIDPRGDDTRWCGLLVDGEAIRVWIRFHPDCPWTQKRRGV